MQKTFSGLVKILFPDGVCTKQETEELLVISMEGRRRVKEQLVKIDETFAPVSFAYTDNETRTVAKVQTLEEKQHPSLARQEPENRSMAEPVNETAIAAQPTMISENEPKPGHLSVPENSKGYGYRRLFAAHLRGAKEIRVQDSYIRAFWQIRNFMELIQLIHEQTPEGEETRVSLQTVSDPDRCVEQDENLKKIQDSCQGSRVSVEFEYVQPTLIHARSITTDTGWKISLDRGLDIYQRYEIGPFSLASAVQDERLTKAFEVTYIRM